MTKARTVLILLVGGMLAVHGFLGWQVRRLVAAGYPDFTIFYMAGKILRQGDGPSLYDEQTQLSTQREFASAAEIRQAPLPFNHPPFEAILFVPFTYLPYPAAYVAWAIVNLALLGSLPFVLLPQLKSLPRLHCGIWVLSGPAFFPVFASLLQGQDSILLLFVYCLTFVAYKKQQPFWTGACLALGLFKFQLVLPFVLVLFLSKKWRVLSGFATVASALVLLSIALVGWHTALYYPRYLWVLEKTQGRGAIVPATMPNLHGLLDTVLAGKVGSFLSNLLVLVISVLLIVLAAKSRNRNCDGDPRQDLAFAFTMIVSVLVSYHVLTYDWTLLVLPALIVLNYLRTVSEARSSSRRWMIAGVACLGFTPLYWILWRYGALNLLAVALLFFAWTVARELFRLPPSAELRC